MKKKMRVLFLVCLLPLVLCGCPGLANGEIEYEIIYPSGNIRGQYSYIPVNIEQTSYQLDNRFEMFEESVRILGTDYVIGTEYVYYLQILDEAGTLLYEYEGLGNDTLWGLAAGDQTAWISSEDWITSHVNGYRSHNLKGSILLRVDLSNGEILFQQEIDAYELYLMSRGTRCYFYDCGEESEEKLFGLSTTEQENARIFYRDVENWEEEVTIYTFDYALYPDIDDIDALRFSLEQEDEIMVLPSYDTDTGLVPFENQTYVIPLE